VRAQAVRCGRSLFTACIAFNLKIHRVANVTDTTHQFSRTAFPKLTNAQRTSVLAQTEIRSGYPLDATRTLHAS
jgi:hypothetical protein